MRNLIHKFEKYISQSWNNPSLQQQHLSGAGPTFEIEAKLKKHFSKKFAITFSSCSTAMLTLSITLNLKGSEIITTPLNWGGSITPFLQFNNKIVFSPIQKNSFNLDPAKLSVALTSKTKAVISVDYNGMPADSKSIKNFCEANDIFYISDSAQSFGAFRDSKPAGFFADFIVLSFGPGKSLYGGEGGAILTDNEEIYEKITWNSQHPLRHKKIFGPNTFNEYAPINGRLNPLSAILLNEMYDKSKKQIEKFQSKNYKLICELAHEGLILKPIELNNVNSSSYFKHQYYTRKNFSTIEINNFFKKRSYPLEAQISVLQLIPNEPVFKNQYRGKFRNSTNYNHIHNIIALSEKQN